MRIAGNTELFCFHTQQTETYKYPLQTYGLQTMRRPLPSPKDGFILNSSQNHRKQEILFLRLIIVLLFQYLTSSYFVPFFLQLPFVNQHGQFFLLIRYPSIFLHSFSVCLYIFVLCACLCIHLHVAQVHVCLWCLCLCARGRVMSGIFLIVPLPSSLKQGLSIKLNNRASFAIQFVKGIPCLILKQGSYFNHLTFTNVLEILICDLMILQQAL